MSLFDDIFSSYILEDNIGDDNPDNQDTDKNNEPDNDQGADNSDNQDDNQQDNDNQDQDEDEYQMNDPETDDTENQDDDNADNEGEEDEYQMQDPEEDNSEEDTQNDDDQDQDEYQMNDPETDDSENQDDDTTDTEGEEDNPSQKLKDIEKSIFDRLTPEEQKAKTAELKNLYTVTYQKCQSIVDLISSIEKAPEQAKIYDYIVKNLVDLQKYIRDYLETLFDSKTYIENMATLQKYLAILDTINNVFEEMKKGAEMNANS